jgi:hypothetical protein
MFIFCTPAAAFDIQKGIHGMTWGSSISEYDELTKVHGWGQAAYYANSNMVFQTAKQPVPGVFYGFYKDQFFAVFIKLRSPDQFSHLERQFRLKHGPPKTTHIAAGRQTVHRWKDKDLKIKLKKKESPVEYKMAIYYAPLSASLNQDQLEQNSTEAFNRKPVSEDKTVKTAPLIE